MILHVFKYLFLNIEFFLSAFYLNYMSSIVFYIIPTEQIFVCPRLQLTVNFEKNRVFYTRRRLNQKKKLTSGHNGLTRIFWDTVKLRSQEYRN